MVEPMPSMDRPGGPGRRRWAIIGLIAAAAVLIAVAVITSHPSGDRAGAVASRLLDGRWRVVDVHGAAGAEPPPAIATDGTLTVSFPDGDRVAFTGCNGGSGPIDIRGDRIVAESLMSTEMACVDEAGEVLMAWDRWMAELLGGGVEAGARGDRIVLTGATGAISLAYDAPVQSGDERPVDPDEPVGSDGVISTTAGTGSAPERPGS